MLPGDATSLDPYSTSYVNVADGSRLSALYDELLWTDPVTGSTRPQIAQSLVPTGSGNAQNREWTLTLHPGVRFSDGTPYDAAAVKYNWDRHKDPAVHSLQQPSAMSISSTEVVSDLVLKIVLTAPNANFDRLVARSLNFVASPAALRASPGGIGDKPVGAGPFVLKQWVRGQRMVLVRNPDYWQKNKGLPYLDQVVINVDTNITRATQQVGHGDDMTVTVDPSLTANAQQRNDVGVDRINLNGGQDVVFNLTKPPFNNLKARQAVVYALDPQTINEQVFHGQGIVARGVFSQTSPLANPQLSTPSNDPTKAAGLFAELTDHGRKPFEFTYIVPQGPQPQAVAEYMKNTLNAYPGVHMSVRVVDIPTYVRTVRIGNPTAWTAALGQQWIDDPEPGIYDLLHSHGQSNYAGFSDPTVDAALDQARHSSDAEVRREAYTRVQVELENGLPFFVYQEAVCAAVYDRSKVTGVQLFNDGLLLWDRIGLRE